MYHHVDLWPQGLRTPLVSSVALRLAYHTWLMREKVVYIHNLDLHVDGGGKKWGSTTIESGTRYIYILKSFVFSDENYMISFVLSVLSCYITCIAQIFHINCIWNKTHRRGPLINWHSHRHFTPPLHLQLWEYMSAREYIFLSHSLCVYRYNKEEFVRRKMYSLALVF